MNKHIVRKMLLLISVFAVIASPLVAQTEELRAKMQQRQAKMVETQMFMNQLMQLGFNSELRRELEIVNDQVKSVKELSQNYQREMMEFHSRNRDLSMEIQELVREGNHEEARRISEEFQDRNMEFSEKFREQANEVLLPHQIDRLNQIARQQRARYSNQFQDEFGIASSLADEIGMSAEEKKRLIDAIKEARKEYYEVVAEAKKKANEKIMGALTTEQKEKLKEILGEQYNQEDSMRKMREEAMKKQREMQKKAKRDK